jgi:hypothetical protein
VAHASPVHGSWLLDVLLVYDPIRYYREMQLETEVVCDRCTLKSAIYGVFGWCPDCGVHNSRQILTANLEFARKELTLVGSVDAEMADRVRQEIALPKNPASVFQWKDAAIRGLPLGSVHSSIRLCQERFRVLVPDDNGSPFKRRSATASPGSASTSSVRVWSKGAPIMRWCYGGMTEVIGQAVH